MEGDSAEGVYYKADSFHDAESILARLAYDKLRSGWMKAEADQSNLPEWMQEPVWIIEIKVRKK